MDVRVFILYILFIAILLFLAVFYTIDRKLKIETWVINLDKNKKRWRMLNKSYQNSDLNEIPIQRYSAVNGKAIDPHLYLSPEALNELYTVEKNGFRTKHYQLTRGGIGCFLSHMNLMKQLVESDAHMYLILEDDAQFHPRSLNMLKYAVNNAPRDWDVLLLTYIRKHGPPVNSVYSKVHGFWGLAGYVVNKRGAAKLIREVEEIGIDAQIDSFMSYLSSTGKLNIYCLNEPIMYTVELSTDIQSFEVAHESEDAYIYRGIYA